jgi:hypothetical protein
MGSRPSASHAASVRLAGDLMAARPDQEVEVRALAGLHHVVNVQALAGPAGVWQGVKHGE